LFTARKRRTRRQNELAPPRHGLLMACGGTMASMASRSADRSSRLSVTGWSRTRRST